MHNSVMQWVEKTIIQLDIGHAPSVLEVGSYDENGSVRNLFGAWANYTGIDMRDGPGVDVVTLAHDISFDPGYFDIVISTETLEHDSQFWLSLMEMNRVLKMGGYMLLTMRGNGFPQHGFPCDYWRFMPDSASLLLKIAGCKKIKVESDSEAPGLMIAGRKISSANLDPSA